MRKLFATSIAVLLGAAWSIGPATAADPADTTDKMERKTERAADKAEDKTESTKDKLKRKSESAMDKVKTKARETKEKISEKMHRNGKADRTARGGDPDIRAAQRALKDKGQDPGPIDGTMGPRTQAALRQYQQAEGLQATGMLDDATKDKLGIRGGSALPRESGPGAAAAPTAPGATAQPEKQQQ